MRVNTFHTMKFQGRFGISQYQFNWANDQNFAKSSMTQGLNAFAKSS